MFVSVRPPARSRSLPAARRLARLAVSVAVLATSLAPLASGTADEANLAHHLLVSEVMTGGTSASDEFIELYNPGSSALPLEGLEVVYVSASGATVTRKAAWGTDAPVVPGGGHLLVANEAGLFAALADVTYANGLAATGGSVALRIQGASTAIDAVGWGSASSVWLEGAVAPAPPAGSSLERLPGGAAGSGQDTDQNVDDFVVRDVPDPQNSTSAPVVAPTPSASPSATVSPTPAGSTLPSGSPSPSSSPAPATPAPATPAPATPVPATPEPTASATTPIADARALPDGTLVTIHGVALTDSTFTDGGGYVADDTAGIAVLLEAGGFLRGQQVTITGELDQRFSQRTIRAGIGGVAVGGASAEPAPQPVLTGDVAEQHEGLLVAVAGVVAGSPTVLTGGLAFDLDDGSGAARIVVGTATGIATSGWTKGSRIELVGVVGQRDSSGTGSAGYRVQPRDRSDVVSIQSPSTTPSPSVPPSPPASASQSPSISQSPSASPSPSAEPVSSIATARAAGVNTRWRVRGVVTAPSGLIDPTSAVLQDATGAIVVRLGDEAGRLGRGELVELSGTRSTRSGMLTLRVTQPPRRIDASRPDPFAPLRPTGAVGEADEARLVTVRGVVSTTPRRSSAGNVYFTLDDGTGPLTVFSFAASGIDPALLAAGALIEARGVVGQETSGSQQQRGYRLWPRDTSDLGILATPPAAEEAGSDADDAGAGGDDVAQLGLADLVAGAAAGATPAGATLVAGSWPELGLAGVLWDGTHAVGLADGHDARVLVGDALAGARPPLAVRVSAGPPSGMLPDLSLPLLAAGTVSAIEPSGASPAPPRAELPSGAEVAWVRISGRVASGQRGVVGLESATGPIELDLRCEHPEHDALISSPDALVVVHGLATGARPRIVVPCGGILPAPALDAVPADTVDAAAGRGVRPVPAAAGPGEEEPPPLAAVLLLAAGLLFGVTIVLVAWHRGALAPLLARLTGSGESASADEHERIHELEADAATGDQPHEGDEVARATSGLHLELLPLPGDRGRNRGG